MAVPALQAAVGQSSANSVFILTAVAEVERAAICGNQASLWLLTPGEAKETMFESRRERCDSNTRPFRDLLSRQAP